MPAARVISKPQQVDSCQAQVASSIEGQVNATIAKDHIMANSEKVLFSHKGNEKENCISKEKGLDVHSIPRRDKSHPLL